MTNLTFYFTKKDAQKMISNLDDDDYFFVC